MDRQLSKLINNAFSFLEKGIDQFKTEPQFSVINFCVSIELLLKARLMHEHWSLIVISNVHPNITQFKAGNFKSLNFKELIPRIEAVIGEKVPKEATEFFNKISDHRNKLLHFYHDAHAGSGEKLIEDIAIEQCNAWFYLRRLLEKWSDVFGPYAERIREVNARMKEHKIYLTIVYERIKPEIDILKKKGVNFRKCRSCEFLASEVSGITDYLFRTGCKVCLFEDLHLKIPCEQDECKGLVILDQESDDLNCPKCHHEISRNYIEDLIDTSDPFDEDNSTINCGLCSSAGDVVRHEDYYVCTNCFGIDENIEFCGWCSEGQIFADLEFSGYEGCGFCDGKKGWDDD